ncbi:hypothetical protein K4K52_007839 [Colletotrichum sp. SAR 10_76]|nr:hypothetical protein K4K52_007839 [Colletotrichum sp. SAR 10_76]
MTSPSSPILAEVAFSQHTADVGRAKCDIDQTESLVHTLIVLDITFLDARKTTFSNPIAGPSGNPAGPRSRHMRQCRRPSRQSSPFLRRHVPLRGLWDTKEYTTRQLPVENAGEDQSEVQKNEHTFAKFHASIVVDELRALVYKAYRRHCKAEQHPCEGCRAVLHA